MIVKTRSITYTDKIEITHIDKAVAIKYRKRTKAAGDGGNFFVSKKDFDAAMKNKKNVFSAIASIDRRYHFYDEEFLDIITNKGFIGRENDMYKCMQKGLSEGCFKSGNYDIDEDRLFYFYGAAHLFYKLDAKNPISIPIRIDYISGVTNGDFNLTMAYNALNHSPHVWDVKKSGIPSYNCFDGRNSAIEFTAKLPQKIYDQLCEYYRDALKDRHWTCRVKDAYVYRPHLFDAKKKPPFDPDFFGLEPCYTGEQ
jgi:hypothetical protein